MGEQQQYALQLHASQNDRYSAPVLHINTTVLCTTDYSIHAPPEHRNQAEVYERKDGSNRIADRRIQNERLDSILIQQSF